MNRQWALWIVLGVLFLVAPSYSGSPTATAIELASSSDVGADTGKAARPDGCDTQIVTVFSRACCKGSPYYWCCCNDCVGRYHYVTCDGITSISVFCCRL